MPPILRNHSLISDRPIIDNIIDIFEVFLCTFSYHRYVRLFGQYKLLLAPRYETPMRNYRYCDRDSVFNQRLRYSTLRKGTVINAQSQGNLFFLDDETRSK